MNNVPVWIFVSGLLAVSFGGSIGTGLLSLVQWRAYAQRTQEMSERFDREMRSNALHSTAENRRCADRTRELEVRVAQLTTLVIEMNPKAAFSISATAGSAINVGGDAIARDKSESHVSEHHT